MKRVLAALVAALAAWLGLVQPAEAVPGAAAPRTACAYGDNHHQSARVGCVKDFGQVVGDWSGCDGCRCLVVGEGLERGAISEGGVQPATVVEHFDAFCDRESFPAAGGERLPVVH